MKIKNLTANWHNNGSVLESQGAGEDYDYYEVGRSGVSEIIEFEPRNGNQLHNFLVKFNDGKSVRVFNPNKVTYFKTS